MHKIPSKLTIITNHKKSWKNLWRGKQTVMVIDHDVIVRQVLDKFAFSIKVSPFGVESFYTDTLDEAERIIRRHEGMGYPVMYIGSPYKG